MIYLFTTLFFLVGGTWGLLTGNWLVAFLSYCTIALYVVILKEDHMLDRFLDRLGWWLSRPSPHDIGKRYEDWDSYKLALERWELRRPRPLPPL